MYLLTNPD